MGCTCEIRVKFDMGGYTNAACLNVDSSIDMLATIFDQIGAEHVVSVDLAIFDLEGEGEKVFCIFENGSFVPNNFPNELISELCLRIHEGDCISPYPMPKYRLVCEKTDDKEHVHCLFAYTDEECDSALKCLNDCSRFVNVYPVVIN